MPHFLHTTDANFATRFAALIVPKYQTDGSVSRAVSATLKQVIARGDAALADLTLKFDNFCVNANGFALSTEEINAAIAHIPQADVQALKQAEKRIRAYHSKQIPTDMCWSEANGAQIGWRWNAVESAGLYIPGGLASYPSSVLMNAIPAKIAGVERLIICTPTPNGVINPLVLLAARLMGITDIYRIGGAQAIAAMAYGTETIGKVDMIAGPGNAYVTAAKQQVFGYVGIDMIAGPSEIVIIADVNNNPEWLALDLLSQAEHDETVRTILLTDNSEFANQVNAALKLHMPTLRRSAIAAKSWHDFGAIIVVRHLDEAAVLSNQLAPEHLQLCVANADQYSQKIRNAGAIFIGAWTPEVIGDYIAGPSHVLPTAQSARFASGLSVLNFMKRTSIIKMTPTALAAIGTHAEIIATAEGLEAHALSLRARLDCLDAKKQI